MRKLCLALLLMIAAPAWAEESGAEETGPDLQAIVDQHIIAGYQTLADEVDALADTATKTCGTDMAALKAAYNTAFDAWVRMSHIRFGPSEQEDRAYALAFWPDSRGFTPRTLQSLLADDDPAIHDEAEFKHVSIAARGFYALEFLLYDPAFTKEPAPDLCALVHVITLDIADISHTILKEWQNGYGDKLVEADNDLYRTHEESLQQLYTALKTGIEFTALTRIGRPMGSFERPRPNRAEVRRSGRSLRHVMLSLEATRDLATMLSGGDEDIDDGFERALRIGNELDDPTFAGVEDVQGRFRVEALQSAITYIDDLLAEYLAPQLGITAGFNSLDGD